MTVGRSEDGGEGAFPDASSRTVMNLIGDRRRVLALGCAHGPLAGALAANRPECRIVGIEVDAERVKRAEKVCEEVVVGDLDTLDLRQALADREFDVVLAVDVLEELKNPRAVLASVKEFIAADGYLVVSIANVAHASTRFALVSGVFPGPPASARDAVTPRFTLAAILEVLNDAGFQVARVERASSALEKLETGAIEAGIPLETADFVRRDPEALVTRYVLLAYPTPPQGSGLAPIPALVQRLDAQEHELRLALHRAHAERMDADRERRTITDIVTALQEQLSRDNDHATQLQRAVEAAQVEVAAARAAASESRGALLAARDEATRERARAERIGDRLVIAEAQRERNQLDHLTVDRLRQSRAFRLLMLGYRVSRKILRRLRA